MDNKKRECWITETEKSLGRSSVLEIVERLCHTSEETDRKHRFFILKSNDWCNIIPITENGNVVFVRQFRVGTDNHTLEIPGGVVDSSDGDIQSAAIRELKEETGYVPLPDSKCINLGWTYPNPAIQGNRCHSFIIGPVKKHSPQNLDHGEMIRVLEMPIEEIPDRILSGEIKHALMLNTFFFLALHSIDGKKLLKNALEKFLSN